MSINDSDKTFVTNVLNTTTKEELVDLIKTYPALIKGSNRNYGPDELSEQVAMFFAYHAPANYLPRTFGIRVQAMKLSGRYEGFLKYSEEAYQAYKARVLQDFDYFNVDEIWGAE